ncbi:MAG TPA: FtsX-like permease family protein [Cyclobacteriaceae bacterium]|nr:FtsX-like permease family protein [Cyclobacteriaceae bacterium]
MHRKDPILPAGVQRLLRTFLRNDLLDEVTGDLHEMHKETLRTRPRFIANVITWYQVLNYLRPFAIKKRNQRHSVNLLPMYKSYFVTALRNMVKNKMSALLNILGLSVGLTVTIVITLWVTDEISHEKNFPNYSRIGRVIKNLTNNGEINTWGNVPWPLSDEIRKNYGADFSYIALTTGMDKLPLSIDNLKFDKSGIFAEPDLAKMLSLEMVYGSADAVKDPSSILISKSTAIAFFGDADPTGKIMKLQGELDVAVGGVFNDIPPNSEFTELQFLGSWESFAKYAQVEKMDDPWRPNWLNLYVQINDNTTFEQASARIKDAEFKKLSEALQKKKPELFILPMSEWHLKSNFVNGKQSGGRIQYVWLFGVVGMFVLLMACINFMNLSTARSEKRAKEVSIRKAIGSLRSQLINQFLSESILTVFISSVIALLLTQLTLPFFNLISEKQMAMPWNEPMWIAGTVIFTIVIGVIAGSYPAFYLSALGSQGTLKQGRSTSILRKALVTIQFTVSVVLIIGTAVVYLQIQHAKNRPLGYNSNGLVMLPTSPEITSHFEALRTELKNKGAILEMAESSSRLTSQAGSSSRFDWKGKDPGLSVDFPFTAISPEYGKTVGWTLIKGRDFSRERVADSSAMILNKAAADYMGFKEPIGEIVRWAGTPFEVVGVVDNLITSSPYAEPSPAVYTVADDQANFVIFRLNPDLPTKESLTTIEPLYKKYNPNADSNYEFTDVVYAKKFGNEERVGTLATTFACLAIFISCLGIFGLSSFTAEQRTKEIGVRKVLGASTYDLWQMMSKDFVVLAVISCAIAVPIAYFLLNDWLENFAYHMGVPIWTFVAATVVTLLITILTVSWHTLNAAGTNPVKSLRTE